MVDINLNVHTTPVTSPQSTESTSSTSTEPQQTGQPDKDRIEKASEAAGLMGIFIMFPQLATPGNNPGLITLEQTEQKCISSMLNQWSENLKVIAQLSQEKNKQDQVVELQNQNQRMAEFVKMAQTLNPATFSGVTVINGADGSLQIVKTNPQAGSPSNVAGVDPTNTGNSALQAGAELGAILLAFIAVGGIGSIGFSDAAFQSINQVVGSVLESVGTSIIDTTGAQALLASLFGTSVVYPSLASFAKGALGGDSDPKDFGIKAAKEFIKNTLAFINSPNFEYQVLSTLPGGMEAAASLPDDVRQKFVALAKLSFALSALAFAYKAETGGGTGAEIWAMANGQIPLGDSDPRKELVDVFQAQLATLNLSPAQLAALESAFTSGIDSSTSFATLAGNINLLKDIKDGGSDIANVRLTQTAID